MIPISSLQLENQVLRENRGFLKSCKCSNARISRMFEFEADVIIGFDYNYTVLIAINDKLILEMRL